MLQMNWKTLEIRLPKSMAVVAKMSDAYITYNMFASEGIKFDAIVADIYAARTRRKCIRVLEIS